MTADFLGPHSGTHHRFVWGDAEITVILDGTVVMPPSPPFLLEKSEAEVAAIASAAHLPADKIENNFVPVVVHTPDALVMVDTGIGAMLRGKGAGFLRERLSEAGYSPADFDVVVLTHVHPDHIGGLREDGELAFPNAQHMIGRREFDEWSAGDLIPEDRQDNRQMFLDVVGPLKDQLRFLDDGDEVVPGMTAEAAFGHTPGHMMFRIKTGGKELLLWGDVANHYVFSVGYPDSHVAFDNDKDMAAETRKRVLAETADSGVMVIGHHMPFPGIGHVERDGSAYRWVPASYQTRV